MTLGQFASEMRFAAGLASDTQTSSDMEHLSGVFSPGYIPITWRLR